MRKLQNLFLCAFKFVMKDTPRVYVYLGDKPFTQDNWLEALKHGIGVINKLEKWVKTKALFDTPAQKETVLNVLESGRNIYEDIIEREKCQEETHAIKQKNDKD